MPLASDGNAGPQAIINWPALLPQRIAPCRGLLPWCSLLLVCALRLSLLELDLAHDDFGRLALAAVLCLPFAFCVFAVDDNGLALGQVLRKCFLVPD